VEIHEPGERKRLSAARGLIGTESFCSEGERLKMKRRERDFIHSWNFSQASLLLATVQVSLEVKERRLVALRWSEQRVYRWQAASSFVGMPLDTSPKSGGLLMLLRSVSLEKSGLYELNGKLPWLRVVLSSLFPVWQRA
jgi:hypothetical protein